MAEAGTDLAVREERALTLIDSGLFAERVAPLLPESVPVRRFLQVAKTAIRTRPELVQADQRSLMGALIRCAQDGLLPDGREAALNVYGDKVQYLPMIGGLRKILADYGWTLKTRCVYTNDTFEYVEEPQAVSHTQARPGVDRGDRIGAYAVATHKDGRRVQIFLDEAEIAKRRAKAKTDKVWREHPDPMAEKSAGHALFDEIPRAERDRMIVPTDNGVDDSVELLYGPDGDAFEAIEAPVGHPSDGDEPTAAAGKAADAPSTDGGVESQQAAASPPPLGEDAVPGADDNDPEPQPAETESVDLELLAMTIVPSGAFAGKTLAEVAETDDGREWIAWALRNGGRFTPDFNGALSAFAGELGKQAA